ncbi:MAG: hypothetical protein IKL37_03595 [Alphaproteobacteria bacterium]|nr:hypothetical protein [Alphaproteobacteria bacterium]MBR6685323.1 hypothetical protein [Alphaproteobacteria bacterium]
MNFLIFIGFVLVGAAINLTYNPIDNNWIGLFIFLAMIVLFNLLSIHTEYITVKSKQIQRTKLLGIKQYIIKTTNGQTFINVNDDFMLKFNAKKLYQELKIGKTYKIKTYRFVMPFSYPYNILSATEIKTPKRKVVKK